VRSPLLTDITWTGPACGQRPLPKRIPDLFSAKPVVLHGRYSRRPAARWSCAANWPAATSPAPSPWTFRPPSRAATSWPACGRAKIDDLMGQDYLGIQRGATRTDVREAVTQLGSSSA